MIQELREHDAKIVLATLKSMMYGTIEMFGIVRRIYFGTRLTQELIKYGLPNYSTPSAALIRKKGLMILRWKKNPLEELLNLNIQNRNRTSINKIYCVCNRRFNAACFNVSLCKGRYNNSSKDYGNRRMEKRA